MDGSINIREFYEGLDILFQRKNPAETMRYMEEWLNKAQAINDTSGIVAISNELGGLCRATGQIDRAKSLYDNVLRLLENMGMAHTEHYATALINYGDVFVNSRELSDALGMFLRARDMLVECGLAGDYRMAALNNNISMVYRDTGELDKAEQALNISFNIIKGLPECRGELATTYINLGELQVRQGKLEMAKESFTSACNIFEEDGGGDVHYSSACAGLGQVYYLKGDKKNAEACYEKALYLIERDFGRTQYYNLVADNLKKVREL
jgi:tetratricopeptide (TPR) repeat protein